MSNLSLPSLAGGASLRADHMQFGHSEMGIDSAAHGPAETSSTTTQKRKRNLPGNPDPEAEVIALSPRTLMASKRFICEVCNKGFQRDQNLQLHRRGHNLPWKLRQRTSKEMTKRVYICPEPSCVHNNPTRALGDLTGIKKHYCRKHGEKKWKCNRCAKRYAVQSDWKAHAKTCGTREYRCDCGTLFSRRDSFITHRAFCDALAEETVRVSNGHLLHHKSPLLFSTTGLSNATQLAVAMNMRLPPPPFPHYLSHPAPSSSSASAGGSSFHGQIAFANQKQKHELFEEPLIQVTKWPYHQDNNNDNDNNSLLGSSNELMMSGNSIQPKLSPARVAARGGGGFSQISQTSFPTYPSDEREPRTMPGFINPSAASFNSGDYHGGQLFHEGGPLAVMFGSGVNSSSSMQGQLSDVGQEICWPYDRSFPLSANGSSSTSTLNPMQNSKTHAAASFQSSLYYSDGSYAAAIDQATHMQADTNCNGFSVTSPLLKGFGMPTPPPFGLSDIFSKSNLKPPLLESTSSSAYMGKTSSTGLNEGIHSLSTLHSHLLSSNPTLLSQTAELPSHRYNLQSMNDQDCSWKKHSMANLSVFQQPTSSSCSPSIPNSIAQSDQKVLTRDFLGMGRPSHVALNTLNPAALGAGRSGGATFRLSEFGNISAISSSTSTATASITHDIEAKPSHHHNH